MNRVKGDDIMRQKIASSGDGKCGILLCCTVCWKWAEVNSIICKVHSDPSHRSATTDRVLSLSIIGRKVARGRNLPRRVPFRFLSPLQNPCAEASS